VDGEGKVAVHPPKDAFWWMARAKRRFIHQMSHFGGWRRPEAGTEGQKKGTGEIAGPN